MNAIRKSRRGQALIEFGLVMPLLFLLIINVVNFGGMFYAWVTVSNAARTGTQYLLMGSASAHAPSPPTLTQVASLVTQDLLSLPNRSSAVIKVCQNNNGVTSCYTTPSGPTGFSPPVDPEAPYFVSGSVDVTYTYQPFISLWTFPNLGVRLTPPPTTIHRQAVMRLAE